MIVISRKIIGSAQATNSYNRLVFLAGSLLAAVVLSTDNITIANLSTGSSCACARLASCYGSLVLTSNSTNYRAEATDYWDVRADLLPRCIFMPIKADQVADAVSVFASCGAQFAIRGGGHMNVYNIHLLDIMKKFFLTDDTVSWFQQH